MKVGLPALTIFRKRPLFAAVAILFAIDASGCGILFGNVKPITEKSGHYRVLDLARSERDWQPVESDGDGMEEPELYTSDLAYQSRTTGAIVMLNSACRPRYENSEKNLRKFTDLLIMGTTSITNRSEEQIEVDGISGLQTTLTGTLNKENIRMRTVVFRRGNCIYDMMYMARPDNFDARLESFERFLASFRFR